MNDVLLVGMLSVCLFTDLKYRKIFNGVLLPVLTVGICLNAWFSGIPGLIKSGQGFLLGLALLFIPFILGGIGAGDVKLLAVMGAVKGPEFVFYSFFGMALAGGVFALTFLIYRGRLLKVVRDLMSALGITLSTRFKVVPFMDNNEENMVPYGVAIVAGAMVAYFVLGQR